MKKYKKGGQEVNGQRVNPAKYFPNCKRRTWHETDDYFELGNNAHKRHPRWKSCVKWRFGATRVEVAANFNNNINRSNLKLTICCFTLINEALQSNQLSPHKNKIADKWRRKLANRAAIKNSKKGVEIVDSRASGIYLTPEAPKNQVNWSSPDIQLGTASGQTQTPSASCKLDMPGLPKHLPTSGHVMPGFHHNLLGFGVFCDADCKFLFTKTSVTIFDKKREPVIVGWRDNNGPKSWNISLLPNDNDSHRRNQAEQTTLRVYSAYDIPSVAALVRYFHAAAGYPVISTCLNSIKTGNYSSWPGLAYNNAARYCPSADKTIKGRMLHTRQGVRSTKSCSCNIQKPQLQSHLRSRHTRLHKIRGHHQTNYTYTCNTHKKVVHRLHRNIPCAVKKCKPVCYAGLSLFQCNFSCSL